MKQPGSQQQNVESPDHSDRGHELTVYLAGPITGLSYGGATGWRHQVVGELAERAPHIRCIDPMRAKQHLAAVEAIGPFGHEGGLLDGHAVVQRDLWDVARSDVLLMNLAGSKAASIGCMVELGWAKAHRRFSIVVLPHDERGPGGNPHDHLFVHEVASALVPDLWAAISILESM